MQESSDIDAGMVPSRPAGVWFECPRAAGALSILLSFVPGWVRAAEPADSALTGYVGRITTVTAWHDIVAEPSEVEFADAYLAALALSYTLARYREDALSLETEGQVVYNYGDQSHWEFNGLLASRWLGREPCDDDGVRRARAGRHRFACIIARRGLGSWPTTAG